MEEQSFSRRLSSNSSFNTSVADYTCDESFDLLPKTDYTYAKSGSYSPRHLRKNYVNPNMSRSRLRGVVTPPVSMLEDSDSESDLGHYIEDDREVQLQRQLEMSTTAAATHSYSSSRLGFTTGHSQSYVGDELDFDSAELNSAENDRAAFDQKERAEMENRMIQHSQHSADSNYRNYYEGMVLRSGSHLKGVKRFLDERDGNRRKSTSVIRTRRSADVQTSGSGPVLYSSKRRSEGATFYTTTVTKTVTEIEKEMMNVNNSARKSVSEADEEVMNINNSARSQRGARTRSRSTGYRRTLVAEYGNEDKRTEDEYQRENCDRRLSHLYGLDHDDISDSDTYTNDSRSSSALTEGYVPQKFRRSLLSSLLYRMFNAVRSVVRTTWWFIGSKSRKSARWLWRGVVNFVAYFILLDAWVLSRRAGRGFCLCLPFLLLLPLLFGSVYYGGQYMPSVSSMPSVSDFFAKEQEPKVEVPVPGPQAVHLRQEVKQILLQLQSEQRQWLTKTEIQTLVRSMLNPEMESLRVSLLNIANEGSFDQSAIKVDQQDAKQRLSNLEEQLAMLQAKAKNLEHDLAENAGDIRNHLARNRDGHMAAMTDMQASLAALQGQMDALQVSFNGLAGKTKRCCYNETAMVALIHSTVNDMMAQMVGDTEGKPGGRGPFGGWVQQNYVDRKEFERQLSTLTADITSKIKSTMGGQRSTQGSSIVLPSGCGSLGEEAVRLIVEDALLKYSADRTGLPDYALESAGGSVISVRCSETYYKKTALISVFGIPLWYTSNSPRTVIQPEVHPGQCWAFKGTSGYIVIQLAVPIRPTGFSLEHIPKSLSMTGNIDSAPRDFTVFGLLSEKDLEGVNLGNFTYQTVGKPIQHFDVQKLNPGVFGFVELRILNNHGNKDYTCLYRFRVHGVPQLR